MTSSGEQGGGGGACGNMVGIERRIKWREECKGGEQGRERSKKGKEGGGRKEWRLKADSVRKQRPVALQHSARTAANIKAKDWNLNLVFPLPSPTPNQMSAACIEVNLVLPDTPEHADN